MLYHKIHIIHTETKPQLYSLPLLLRAVLKNAALAYYIKDFVLENHRSSKPVTLWSSESPSPLSNDTLSRAKKAIKAVAVQALRQCIADVERGETDALVALFDGKCMYW